MRAAGLDIGSRSIELVIVDVVNSSGAVVDATAPVAGPTARVEAATGLGGPGRVARPTVGVEDLTGLAVPRRVSRPTVVVAERIATTPTVAEDCRGLVSRYPFDRIVVTGYGRAMAEVSFGFPSVTEIKAYARGAEDVHPGCRSVLDIGGQDTKAIALDGSGRALRFEMNDRCAAGAGRFLEMMAAALDYDVGAFGAGAVSGDGSVQINSMCAVFAESEVVGLLTRGARREDIALAVHRVVASRAAAMLRRVSLDQPIVFAGGAARNPALRVILEELIGRQVHVPEMPEMVGALGAALIASEG